jgi:outer membrane protein OmpA-like peptidoglycan-associated protein
MKMKTRLFLTVVMLIALISGNLIAEEKEEMIPTFAGSKPHFDDAMGYNEFYICVGDSAENKPEIKKIEGYVRHRFCYLPKGRSYFEMFKNYEEAILKMDGTVFPISNKKAGIKAFMKKGHPRHGMKNYEYMQLPSYAGEYFSGMIPTDTVDHYIAIAVANVDGKYVYSLITVETKPMDMGMVTLENLDSGLVTKGHIAIYDIFFETGKSEIKGESYDALKMIAEYIKAHTDKKYLVVGHTDNVGVFDANIKLSNERANAVINNLIVDHSVNKEQLKSYGVGPAAPVSSNSTDEGKAKNRRVEIVEQ